jgi:hypothetical protein
MCSSTNVVLCAWQLQQQPPQLQHAARSLPPSTLLHCALLLLLLLLLQFMDVCSAKQRALYLEKLISNVQQLSYYHAGLFLGETMHSCC